jgi:hypothetical protein
VAEREDLFASIAATTADYREGDLPSAYRGPGHVKRWINQFDDSVQLPILREVDHVLKKTYVSRADARKFLITLFGDDPCTFWKNVKFLDIQLAGASQKAMLVLFSKILKNECHLEVEACGATPRAFVYLDDAIFTGNRVASDVAKWVAEEAPNVATVHVVTMALHRLGKYYAEQEINKAVKIAGKKIDLRWWSANTLEDRKNRTDVSDVLRPVAIPDDEEVATYVKGMGNFEPHLRTPGNVGQNAIFSNDQGRQVLEEQFLIAGVRIRSMCPNLQDAQRPLGRMKLVTLGFGSLIVTFRNCPNNVPLAFWVDSPWYPLFPRTTNSDTSLGKFKAMLAQEGF